ncbi:MAG: ABC transporter ATP-binding protein [Deltaproteobacteria bacterium]|nr:MAG: ABC transporter ATP-binding protein [Deltaproteobacteria bacterium]
MKQSLLSIWQLLQTQRSRYLLAIGALVFASCFMYLVPMIPQMTLDGVLSSQPEKSSSFVQGFVALLGGRAWLQSNLWLPAALLIGLSLLAGLFTYLRGRWSAQASETLVRGLRDRVYRHLQYLPSRYYDKVETGDLVQRCTSDMETLRVFLSTQIVEIGRALIMFLVPLPLMYMIHPWMMLVSISLLIPILCWSLFYFPRIRSQFTTTDEAEADMTSTLQENLEGIRVVRAFARQDFEEKKFQNNNQTHRDEHYQLYVQLAHFWAVSDLLCFMQQALVLGFGVFWLAQGSLQIGAFFFFLSAVNLFLWPVRMMGRILTDLGKATVAIERIQEILKTPDEDGHTAWDRPNTWTPDNDEETTTETPETFLVPAFQLKGGLSFQNVSFCYNQHDVLQDISFSVEPGQTLALVGPSGSGKSTIIQLLLRLYDVETGTVQLDGHDLSTLPRQWLRSQIAVVLQEPFLFSKTLFENLRLAVPHADEHEVIEAAQMASLHDSILEFSEGYKTQVGERGVTLSGGQRQRTALARALLQDPAILVLDDSMSAVDTETEAAILDALKQRNKHHTTILIAHRLSTLMHADHILVMDEGRIVQSGTHQTLIQESGLYERLWNLQRDVEEQEEKAA